LFVRVCHHETAGVELASCLADVFPVLGVRTVARHIHAEDVRLGLAVDHPFGKALADAATLQEARHDAAGAPVARLAAHRSHQRVAIGQEGKGPVHPGLDAHVLQDGVAFETQHQFAFDPVGVFLLQFEPVVPWRAVHHPVLVIDLVDAQQHSAHR